MIQHHEAWTLIDQNGDNSFEAEVNWSRSEKVSDCKVVRFRFPDGKLAVVKREHLHEMLFAIGKPEEQIVMIPEKFETVHHQRQKFSIKATRDIHKGEEIVLPEVTVKIPCGIAKEVLGPTRFYKELSTQQLKTK